MNDNNFELTHINHDGEARMVDVSSKDVTKRVAKACGFVKMNESTLQLIKQGLTKKGDVLATSRIAGIMAAKKTSDLIPLCHPLQLSKVEVTFDFVEDVNNEIYGIKVTSECALTGKTGVEMEALSAVSVSALTIYDMCKAVDRAMRIEDIHLLHKQGGNSGTWDFE